VAVSLLASIVEWGIVIVGVNCVAVETCGVVYMV